MSDEDKKLIGTLLARNLDSDHLAISVMVAIEIAEHVLRTAPDITDYVRQYGTIATGILRGE